MTEKVLSRYSAGSSLIGYLYQCRYALLESIIRLPKEEEFTVSIETLDDVVFEETGKPSELLQMKHHIKSEAKLTNASSELWKTLRIWCKGISSGELLPDTIFFLVTTATASNNTAAVYLKCEKSKRNIKKALKILNEVTKKKKSDRNKEYYKAFNELDEDQKEKLLNRVFIMDASPSITDIEEVLREKLFYNVPSSGDDNLGYFIEILEGWWYRQVIQILTSKRNSAILSIEINDQIDKIRDGFKRDNLPLDDEIILATVNEEEYMDCTFVHQLKLIQIDDESIFWAIKNYFRAFTHRSRWARNNLLLKGEIEIYEDLLLEQWSKYFRRMNRKIGNKATQEKKIEAAQALYELIEDIIIPIRISVNHFSITIGSYQILSENKRLGWHPDFKDLLEKLVEVKP